MSARWKWIPRPAQTGALRRCSPGLNVVTGPYGCGKTSLIEHVFGQQQQGMVVVDCAQRVVPRAQDVLDRTPENTVVVLRNPEALKGWCWSLRQSPVWKASAAWALQLHDEWMFRSSALGSRGGHTVVLDSDLSAVYALELPGQVDVERVVSMVGKGVNDRLDELLGGSLVDVESVVRKYGWEATDEQVNEWVMYTVWPRVEVVLEGCPSRLVRRLLAHRLSLEELREQEQYRNILYSGLLHAEADGEVRPISLPVETCMREWLRRHRFS